jgi:hypothetical protein
MALRPEKRSTASLAGWLFADLSIILMILFASSGLTSDDLRCDKQEKLSGNSLCDPPKSTTSTIDPGNGGIRPTPIEVTVNGVRDMSPATFQKQIEEKIMLLAKSDSKLQEASNWDFGVVLIYGGAQGRKDIGDGDRVAKEARNKLSPNVQNRWSKLSTNAFFEPAHDKGIPYGSVKLKLFPIIPK